MAGRWQLGFPFTLLLFGFLVASGFAQERLRERDLPSQRQELEALVRQRQADVRDLAAEVAGAAEELAQLQQGLTRGSFRVQAVVEEAERLRGPAGLAGLSGPGVVVELVDSPRAPSTQAETTDLKIQDVDLQVVVNILWSAGAEGVSVNGRRVVSTTAIRQAGGSILVNYERVASPYRVVAVGDARALHERVAGSDAAQRFAVWEEIYGLSFSVRRVDEVAVPSLRGVTSLRWAEPVREAP